MADVHDKKIRRKNMAAIKSRNTKPELTIRRELYARGYRYRLHSPALPGKPDLILRSRNAVIFINGCFWHGHDCDLFKWPGTNPDFWRTKIEGNRKRDKKVVKELTELGWRVGVIWECSLRGKKREPLMEVIDKISIWLSSEVNQLSI